MSFVSMTEHTIVKCDNPDCRVSFSVVGFSFDDEECHIIGAATMIPLTGNTPYYCPCCGKNLGMPEADYRELKASLQERLRGME